jgi:hypothetical protein
MTRLYHRAAREVIANFRYRLVGIADLAFGLRFWAFRLLVREHLFRRPKAKSLRPNQQSEIGNVVVLSSCGNALPDTEAVKDVQLCSVP